jgi:hypothetical protein
MIDILKNKWIVLKGSKPIPLTISNTEDVCIKRFENLEKITWLKAKNSGYKIVEVNVYISTALD